MKRKRLVAAFIACVALPAAASAHPHVFIDARAGFVLKDKAQLEAVQITWVYDAFTSLKLMEILNLDQDNDGVLSDEDLARVVAAQTVWPDEFEGDTYLEQYGQPVPLARPINGSATTEGVQIAVSFDLPLVDPLDATQEVELRLYDPTYYYAYATLDVAPTAQCKTELARFEASQAESALQSQLARLSREETPSQKQVGRLFADVVRLQCE